MSALKMASRPTAPIGAPTPKADSCHLGELVDDRYLLHLVGACFRPVAEIPLSVERGWLSASEDVRVEDKVRRAELISADGKIAEIDAIWVG